MFIRSLGTTKLTAAAIVILSTATTGCSTIETVFGKQDQTVSLSQSELATLELNERLGTNYESFSQSAPTLLRSVKQRAMSRYSSTAPRDLAEIYITKAIYIKGSIFNLRDTSLTISRGDSRQIELDDVEIRFSGVSTKLRVTYSENQGVFINGKRIGSYTPGLQQFADINVPSGDGTFSARISF